MLDLPASVADYYASRREPHQQTLLELRRRIISLLPTAVEVMKYRMPTFIVDGKHVCGIMAHTRHIGFYPYSGSALEKVPQIAAKYGGTKSALHLPIDKPIPLAELRQLIRAKQI